MNAIMPRRGQVLGVVLGVALKVALGVVLGAALGAALGFEYVRWLPDNNPDRSRIR